MSPTLTLPAIADSAARARQFLREQATLDSMRHAEADLLVTELIGNALQHAPEADELAVTLDIRHSQDIVVTVSHPFHGEIGEPEKGAGFTLLDRLSKRWGHESSNGTLSISFVLRTPGSTTVDTGLDDEQLFERMADDPVAFSDELVRRHTDLARSIARRYRGKGVDEDDLFQVAQMALLKAIQRYDPAAGNIRPYAAATISGEMKKLLRDRGWSVRVPRSLQERSLEVARTAERMSQALGRPPETREIASELSITDAEVEEAMRARHAYASNSMDKRSEETGRRILDRLEDEDFRLSSAEDRVVVEEAIAKLPQREQEILHLRFNEDLTQSDIAERIGISQMHVSRLLRAALDELRSLIEASRSEV